MMVEREIVSRLGGIEFQDFLFLRNAVLFFPPTLDPTVVIVPFLRGQEDFVVFCATIFLFNLNNYKTWC